MEGEGDEIKSKQASKRDRTLTISVLKMNVSLPDNLTSHQINSGLSVSISKLVQVIPTG